MKNITFSFLFILTSITSCTQETKVSNRKMLGNQIINIVPFLTKENVFIYVDKTNLKPVLKQKFRSASLFTYTGFAYVGNEKNEFAVIDKKGNIILDFSDEEVNFNVVNGLTFYKKQIEYEKKMPIYKWDWNILGGDIKKEQTYHKIEVGILESKQILLRKDVPYLEDNIYLNIASVDENHVFWSGKLYEIKKNRLDKVETGIAELLDNKRFIKSKTTAFSIFQLGKKNAFHSELAGTETISIRFGQETITLKEVNKERYAPEISKILEDTKTGDTYAFPQYDKVFPKEIKKATPSQIDFIKKTSLVYSINNSPYFLLGVFNYDEKVWAYDWLYIDTAGNVVNELKETYNFKVLDQVGNLVWPDRKMIFPDELNTEKWKFGKIKSFEGMADLYIIPIENQKGIRTKGLWNSSKKNWEITPEYYDISVLDTEKQIYALQKEEKGLYTLYNNLHKKSVSAKAYYSINSDGLVSIKQNSGELIFYYIDIYSGKEYREN
ncbi:hypothetical protein [Epilithonimonas sp.]|uniref:hypothetical protein n=1 Tax=Epilithonimonas sp. TaxID=2894511 RepID=UPI00289DCE0A|nr:hypothetical protein [Epilithonimonas sp.]